MTNINTVLEPLSVEAFIVAIVEAGPNLSLKLATFAETVRTAEQSIRHLSNDVSATCALL